jgi:S-adenosylmethionine hydrolase
MKLIALISDFGTRDGYVGEMKGALVSSCPEARLVDVTHDIEPGDVGSAAWTLDRIWSRFPAGTVYLVVVDPGVGSDRRAVAARRDGRWFVGPDNGILAGTGPPVPDQAWEIDPEAMGLPAPSTTFHGRDVFAPAAAYLSCGKDPSGLGPPLDISTLERLERPRAERIGEAIRGEVSHVDRFGNLITNIPGAWVNPTALIEVGGEVVSGLRTHYAMVEPGELVAVIGSGGTLEISVRSGSAAARLGATRRTAVRLRTHRD